MIDYTLAKRLKDAGFSQMQDRDEPITGALAYTAMGEIIEYDDSFWRNGEPLYYIPTLSELIDACEDRFGYLQRVHGGWVCFGYISQPKVNLIDTAGQTKEAAVAGLWLALNTK